MAQHFYGPPQDFTGLYTVPSSTTGYASSALPPTDSSRLSTPPIKEECKSTSSNHQEVETKQTSRPKKRQKTEDGESSHKFVSQKKWKFSEAQPWLPSKLSSKAQNASKASYESKVEPESPTINPFSQASASVSFHTASTGPDQASSLETSNSTNRRTPSTEHNSLNNASLWEPSRFSAEDTTALSQAGSANKLLPPTLITRPKSPMDTIESDLAPKKRSKSGKGTTKPVTALPTGSPRLPSGNSKSMRGLQTLSLEKDAERISALIAEKKKENESNMFRERLLKRQQKHKDQIQPDDENYEDATLQAIPQSRSVSQVISDSDRGSPSVVVDVSSSIDENRESTSPAKDQFHSASERFQRPPPQGHTGNDRSKGRNITSGPQLPVNNTPDSPQKHKLPGSRQQSNAHKEIFFGSGAAVPPPTANQPSRSTKAPKNNARSEVPPKGSAPFEVEDADLTAQLVAFTNQLIPKDSTQRMRTGHTPSDQGSSQNYYPKQILTSLPMAQTRASFCTSPKPHSAGFDMTEGTSVSLPSSAHASYSHSPTNIPIHHFSHMDIASSQQHQSAMMYNPNLIRNRPASVSPVSTGPVYHGMHQQIWTQPNQHEGQSNMAGMSTQMGMVPRQGGMGTMSGPSTKAPSQRRQSHQDMQVSNTNMFNGNERINVGSSANPTPPKPRVNMFSDTKGTPFPMDDIIRQIEMT